MVQYRDLNAPPSRMLADVVADMKAEARQSKTGAHGVKDMGRTGDSVFTRPDGTAVSVRDIDADLAAARVRIADAEVSLEATEGRIAGAEKQLEATGGQLSETREALDALDSRVDVTALQVSRGPLPPTGAPLGAQWLTPEGYLYVRVDCDEEAA